MEFLSAFFSTRPSSCGFQLNRGQKIPIPKKIKKNLKVKSDLCCVLSFFHLIPLKNSCLGGVMVFNATFNNISVIS